LYELIDTEDGSLTCRDSATGELFHNRAGAYLEALKNYAEPADLKTRISARAEFSWLDVCFGMGYNTWVALQELFKISGDLKKVTVTAIELDNRILETLPLVLSQPCFAILSQVIGAQLSAVNKFGEYHFRNAFMDIELKLLHADLREQLKQLSESDQCDLIFHDPFSPSKVPELWTVEVFSAYKRMLKTNSGALLTYSSAGSVRGAFSEVGFHVYRTSSVGAKIGGTLASLIPIQTSHSVFELNDNEKARIGGAGGVPFRDLGPLDSRDTIVKRRQNEQEARFGKNFIKPASD
jgi:tRNA U34 5-methylaminomethyl-2-thiouridine-forming methyltransferase MnmC